MVTGKGNIFGDETPVTPSEPITIGNDRIAEEILEKKEHGIKKWTPEQTAKFGKIAIAVLILMAIPIVWWMFFTSPALPVNAKNPTENMQSQQAEKLTGPATSSPNTELGQETKIETSSYIPKYNLAGASVQEVALNNLPGKLLLTSGGTVYMTNLKVKDNYLYGDLVSTIDLMGNNVRVAFIDKNGQQMPEAGVTGLLYGGYDGDKKLNVYQDHQIGPINLKKGKERYFRILLPKGVGFIQTIS